MNKAQEKIYNLMIDNILKGSKMSLFMPRNMGKKTLKEEIDKVSFVNKIVHDKGRRFYSVLLPKDIPRGEVGDCFDYCLVVAMKSEGRYRYCEGMAHIDNRWLHHAWLTDKDGMNAFDPTWKAFKNDGTETPLFSVQYIGVILDLELVMDFVMKTRHKSPLANHKLDPGLAQQIYDTAY